MRRGSQRRRNLHQLLNVTEVVILLTRPSADDILQPITMMYLFFGRSFGATKWAVVRESLTAGSVFLLSVFFP
jgi:hypothetical protein